MKVQDPQVQIVLILFHLISFVSGTPISGKQGVHQLAPRGIVSPTNDELLYNTIGFAIPAVIAFVLRM
jgi:hypothetical protein